MDINRAIEIVTNMVPKHAKLVNGTYKGGYDNWESEEGKAIKAVVEAAKRANTDWIPVSERLPEDGIYLVTCDDEDYPVKRMRLKRSVGIPIWYISRGIYDGRVFAWMPLPEPYKAE